MSRKIYLEVVDAYMSRHHWFRGIFKTKHLNRASELAWSYMQDYLLFNEVPDYDAIRGRR